MKRKYLITAAIIMTCFIPALFSATGEDNIQTVQVTKDRLAFFPVPKANINYLFFQSFKNDSSIIIGDFEGVDKKIIMIVDRNNDNTVDEVYEYTPSKRDLKKKSESNSKFFTKDIAKLKKEIIEGTVFDGNYTDRMESLKTLTSLVVNANTNSLNPDVYGFNVRVFESDETHKNRALFSYGKSAGGYYLQFKTEYYRKNFTTEQVPILRYSVYCKDSSDPIVKDTVERLFTIRQPIVNFDKTDSLQKGK